MQSAERLSEHTHRLPPLSVGDHVRLQNQVGPFPRKWDKTGVVIEVCQFDQYVVRIDGSRRVTLRNRKFLRKYVPVQGLPKRLTIDADVGLRQPPAYMPPVVPTAAAPDTAPSPGMSTPVKHVSKLPDMSPLPAPSPTMEPPCETPTHTLVRQSDRQLTYTEPQNPDVKPLDLPLGPPLVEMDHVPAPTVEATPTSLRRSSRVKHGKTTLLCEETHK